jgi:hypothetical protein
VAATAHGDLEATLVCVRDESDNVCHGAGPKYGDGCSMNLSPEVVGHGLSRGIVDDKLPVEVGQFAERKRPCRLAMRAAVQPTEAGAQEHRCDSTFNEQASCRWLSGDVTIDRADLRQ